MKIPGEPAIKGFLQESTAEVEKLSKETTAEELAREIDSMTNVAIEEPTGEEPIDDEATMGSAKIEQPNVETDQPLIKTLEGSAIGVIGSIKKTPKEPIRGELSSSKVALDEAIRGNEHDAD